MMLKYIKFICILSLIKFSYCIDYDGWININMQHNLFCKNEQFCNRGDISLKSLRSGAPTIIQIPFTNDHIEELKELAKANGFYTVKTLVSSADNKESEFMSSIKAQDFLDNDLTDTINAWVLPSGAMVAVTFHVTNFTDSHIQDNEVLNVNSNFYLRQVDQAPLPDTASYIQKLEREREAKEKGETKDNRSFLAKYWMYIVPVAIFVMISGASSPEAPQS